MLSTVLLYLLGLAALLGYSRMGGVISSDFLAKHAARPLLLSPWLSWRFLFGRYLKRLKDRNVFATNVKDCFEIPITAGDRLISSYDGSDVINTILSAIGEEKPVIISGKAGSGKSVLLARIGKLALEQKLPKPFDRILVPVLVSSNSYKSSVFQTIADVLSSHGVLATEDVVKSQLEAGNLLILFDDTNDDNLDLKEKRLQEIAETAKHARYGKSGFIIATRPTNRIPGAVTTFQMQPLSRSNVDKLLDKLSLPANDIARVRDQLEDFADLPIPPPLLAIILDLASTGPAMPSRSEIYRRYFAALLGADAAARNFNGWHDASEVIAKCTLLNTGKRNSGRSYEDLMSDLVAKRTDREISESSLERLQRLYPGNISDARALLTRFEAMGLLQGGDVWRFNDAGIEMYFAASYIRRNITQRNSWPLVNAWTVTSERQRAFLPILDFVRELFSASPESLLLKDLPFIWKRYLEGQELYPPRLLFEGREYLYIPAGQFKMGTEPKKADELCAQFNDRDVSRGKLDPELPQHLVDVEDFYIARYPVTNADYKKFVDERGHPLNIQDDDLSRPYNWNLQTSKYQPGQEDYPVVMVSWHDARKYCEWLGARLPTEAEWEKAARGTDGREWPWGEWNAENCNCGLPSVSLAPVGKFSPRGDSPYGVSDMSGNVWDWCSSILRDYPYRADDGREDPDASGARVIRGGAAGPSSLKARCAFRQGNDPNDYGFSISFRVVLTDASLSKAQPVIKDAQLNA